MNADEKQKALDKLDLDEAFYRTIHDPCMRDEMLECVDIERNAILQPPCRKPEMKPTLRRREPPYDEFFDRHHGLLWLTIIVLALLAMLAIVAFIGAFQ